MLGWGLSTWLHLRLWRKLTNISEAAEGCSCSSTFWELGINQTAWDGDFFTRQGLNLVVFVLTLTSEIQKWRTSEVLKMHWFLTESSVMCRLEIFLFWIVSEACSVSASNLIYASTYESVFFLPFCLLFTWILCAGLRGAQRTPCGIWQYLVHIKFNSIPVCLGWIWFLILYLQPQTDCSPETSCHEVSNTLSSVRGFLCSSERSNDPVPFLKSPAQSKRRCYPVLVGWRYWKHAENILDAVNFQETWIWTTAQVYWKKQGFVGDWQRDLSRVHWKLWYIWPALGLEPSLKIKRYCGSQGWPLRERNPPWKNGLTCWFQELGGWLKN